MQRVLAIALAALALATLAGSATAENAHIYSGSYCKAYFGNQEADLIHAFTGTYNAASAVRSITCPVLVDEVSNTDGTTQVWVHWTTNANAPNNTLTCGLTSLDEQGGFRQGRNATRTGTGRLVLPNVTNDDPAGSYLLICYLPSAGTINTIYVGEKD